MKRFLKHRLGVVVVTVVALVLGIGGAVAIGAGETTGTNTSCATAPDHTVGVDGSPVATITGTTACHTETYTIPTVTQTVTVTTPTTTTTTTTSGSFTCPTGVRCFYIANTGSDSNSGTSESSPWAHVPGMPSFTGTYTHQAGDEFILRGGDTWGNANFPLAPTGSGAASAVDYYGVDPGWFSGSTWAQPTFTDGGTSSTMFVNLGSHTYVQVDGIHYTGFHWTGASGNPRPMIFISGSHVSVTNSLFDGWSHDAGSGCSGGTCDDGWAIWDNQGTNLLIKGNQFDQGTGSYDSGGAFDSNGGGNITFDHNTCFHLENCYQAAGGTISNNQIHDMGFGDYDSTNHQNDIEALTGSNAIFNNVVHDTFFGSFTIDYHASGTNYVYNNVVWNNGREGIDADCSLGGGCGSGTSYLYNNTVAPSGSCFRFVNRGSGENTYSNVTEDNNHCVGTLNGIDSGATVPGLVQNTNLTQTASQASSTGYTAANKYAPTSASSPTVDAGTNLTSSCSGSLTALCSSVDGNARATTAAWDEGAYEWLP